MGLWLVMKLRYVLAYERHSILASLLPFLFNEDYQLLKTLQFIHRSVRLNRVVIRGMAIVMPFLFRTTVK